MGKYNFNPHPIPDMNGYPTAERAAKSPNGFTPPLHANSPTYINSVIRAANAPENAPAAYFDGRLNTYELTKLLEYLGAKLAEEGRISIASYDGVVAPKGKMAGGKIPFKKSEQQLISWKKRIDPYLPVQIKCGLELLNLEFHGKNTKTSISDIGRIIGRTTHPIGVKAATIAFFVMTVHAIEKAERDYHADMIRKNVRVRTTTTGVGL